MYVCIERYFETQYIVQRLLRNMFMYNPNSDGNERYLLTCEV
jgi:hypothetical protein